MSLKGAIFYSVLAEPENPPGSENIILMRFGLIYSMRRLSVFFRLALDNFIVGNSTITITNDVLESLVKQHAGSGQRVSGVWGEANYKERIDFGKIIGEYVIEKKGEPIQYIPTSKGIIHYAKDGVVHIVPSDPSAIIY